MSRLIDAEWVTKKHKEDVKEFHFDDGSKEGEYCSLVDYVHCFHEAPTIDAVEVVRCGECQLWDEAWKTCGLMVGSLNCKHLYEADDFCSKGEKK